MAYRLPQIQHNQRGEARTVGFEIEFAGLGIQQAAEIIVSLYGGKLRQNHRHSIEILDTELGNFRVELDAHLLRKMAREDIFNTSERALDENSFRKSVQDIVDKLAMSVVPVEVVMPPLPVSKLEQFEKLREALQVNKAKGTEASFVHAFGMHINIETPDLKATTLLRYVRAFMIMYPWLLSKLDVDFSRRISPFVAPYPERYVRKVLDPAYRPAQNQLIDDYLQFNPTRNRPLDMLPIFGMLNNDLIRSVAEREQNVPRPTFHYRLPNSKIDDPDWRLEDEWNYWLTVERLADDPEMCHKLSRLYLVREKDTLISFHKEWAQTVQILLSLDE